MLHKRAVEAVKNRRRMLMGDVALPDNCKCGGLFEEVGHEWLGEDDKGVGSTKVTQQCEKCGHVRQYIIGENGSLKVTRDADPWVELYTTNLGKRIKQMPINRVTEQILNKIKDYFAKQKAKEEEISEQEVFNLLSSQERDYLFKDSTGAFEKGELEAEDIYTKDTLTEKGKEILAAMKEQYGEEEGEKIFYASKNKGTIEGVDSFAPQEFNELKAWQNKAMELNYRLENNQQRGLWVAYRGNQEVGTFVPTRGGQLYVDAAIKRIEELSDDFIVNMIKAYPRSKDPTQDPQQKELIAEAAKRGLGSKFLTGDSTPSQTRRIEELTTAIKAQRLAGHTKDAERLEEELGKELEKTAIEGSDYRGYKTTDQIYKGFMVYKSGKNPARFTLKNESGIEYEGSLEDAKKQVDEYWNRRDEEVVNQKLHKDSKTKDAKNIVSYVSSQIESEKRKLRGKRIVENFGQDIVRKLRDRLNYNELRYGGPEERMAAGLIDAFDDWCSSYTGDQDFSISVNSVLKQRLKNVARKLKNNRLGLGPGGGRRDGSGLEGGGNGMQSAGLGGRKQLQGDAETTIFAQQGYKIVKLNNGMYAVSGPTISSNEKSEFYSPDIARAFIIERMKRDGVYGKFGKDAKANIPDMRQKRM